jgi:hypothetical protein
VAGARASKTTAAKPDSAARRQASAQTLAGAVAGGTWNSPTSVDFAGIPVNRRTVAPRVQAKPDVDAPADAYEAEAEEVARRVLAPSAPQLPIRRGLERQPGNATGVPKPAQRVIGSPGVPLDPGTRAFMEPRFGRDFSSVRVHSGPDAAESARRLHAEAYTVGSHIVLGSVSPASREARGLLAHELTHVVQQTGGATGGPTRIGATASPRVQRQPKSQLIYGAEYEITFSGGGYALEKELLRLGFLQSSDYESWGFLSDGYYFAQTTGQGETYKHVRVLDAHYVRNDKGDIVGYRIVSWLGRSAAPVQTPPGPGKLEQKPPGKKAPPERPAPEKKPAADKQPAEKPKDPPAKTPEQLQAEFDALPKVIKDLLRPGGKSIIKPEDMPQLLRIAKKLQALTAQDLELYKLLATRLAADLDAFEKSIDVFIKVKAQVEAAALEEKAKQKGEPTLEEKLQKTWEKVDEKQLAGMTPQQKENLARKIAAEQRDIQLDHMLHHPAQTAADMAKGVVRVDQAAKAVVDNIKEAADCSKPAAARAAGALGAYNKAMGAVAGIVFIALLFVPGVNLLELAVAGLAVTAATIALSSAESELRIQAAGESTTTEEFKTQTEKAAAAQVNIAVSAAMLALTLALKIVARIPLPGRYQNVGAAFSAAQKALLSKTGIGPAWVTVKTELVNKLKSAKQGLREALATEAKQAAATANTVQGMTGDEFIQHLADGDPKLADLGIPADQAKATQQLAKTPAGKGVPEQLRKDSLAALQDAPVEAQKRVEQFIKDVDDAAAKVDKAQTPEQLKAAVDDAAKPLDPESQAKKADADANAYVKKRIAGAVQEQAKKRLVELNKEQLATQATIERLESELHAAENEVTRLQKEALKAEPGSKQRADLVKEVDKAKAALQEIKEADELGGYREDRSKLNKKETALLESLGLKRPGLGAATKDAIKKAAKRNAQGEFLDANTGEVIKGDLHYGHKYGFEHRRLVLKATEMGMGQEAFNRWVNEHPEWFQLETEANNLSHRFEKPGID